MVARRRFLLGMAGSVPVAGCDVPARLASLPDRLGGKVTFHGFPSDIRAVLDGDDDALLGRESLDALRREIAYARSTGVTKLPASNFLAISGGGENGAYGAGLLTQWSELGTRPVFKAVTGVSTGALTAPFAFLGPAYDGELERFYTTIGKSDVMRSRGLVAAVFGESLYDSTPLLDLIRRALTQRMVAEIGREHSEKGRILCVATTNLDVPVGVLWNIGAIAASGNAGAHELISRILLASASIPGAFPPVMIDVEAGGERFQEMHVDGGTVAQVVFYPPSFSGRALSATQAADRAQLLEAVGRRRHRLFVIRNSRPGADMQTIDRSTFKIVGRAVSTLIATQGIGDLYRLYVIAQRDGIDYNVAWIPESFRTKLPEPFDRAYMNELYQIGRAAMRSGTAWSGYPPGYDPTPLAPVRLPVAG